MATNPFSGILSSAFKQTHKNMIDAMLEQSGCGQTCRLVYSGTKWEDAPNTPSDPIGSKPGNVFHHGGRTPIHASVPSAPVGEGSAKRPEVVTEDVVLYVFWGEFDRANRTRLAPFQNQDIKDDDSNLFTIGAMDLLPKLRKASEIILATSLEGYVRYRAERVGDPKPVGFSDDWVVCSWKLM